MTEAPEGWLTIIGIGEDGPAGLGDASRSALASADLVFGGQRHLALAGIGADRARPWPVPFDLAPLLAERGRQVVALVSGDPFWHGAGTGLAARLERCEWRALPAPGLPTLAAARLGWPLEEVTSLGLHAAPFARLRPHLHDGARILVTLRDGAAVAGLAGWLSGAGWGDSTLVVLEALGGPRERIRETPAEGFALSDIQAPVAVAIYAQASAQASAATTALPRTPGLPDSAFSHDGQITKAPVRALTLSALAPRPGEHLWDIGGGSGSVSIEWALAGGRASVIEPRADRLENIRANAAAFGLEHRITVVPGAAPEALAGLAAPQAIFVGGGFSDALMQALLPVLAAGARLVVNGVTLETQAALTGCQATHGGRLLRIELAEAAPLGRMTGWAASRMLVQWSLP